MLHEVRMLSLLLATTLKVVIFFISSLCFVTQNQHKNIVCIQPVVLLGNLVIISILSSESVS